MSAANDEIRVGRYRLFERVARGGMAEVWKARAPDGTVVCVKRLDPSLRNDVDFIEMFRDEASLVLDFDHGNIVKVYELIDDGDELAMVMELVDGPSLAKVRSALDLRRDAGAGFGVDEALQIGIYLCRALHHAHTRMRHGEPLKIVHRDVSPQNVLVSGEGHIKLVDFGIAKATQRLTRTRAGALKGKCSYMAPEQVRGDGLDHRADQFAAGILLWEMLTGRRLFSGRNEILILEQVARSDAVPPSTIRKDVPRAVDRAVLRALGWHRDERFPDMAAFERALQDCLDALVAQDAPGGVAKDSTLDLRGLVQRAARAPVEMESGALRTRVMASAPTEEGKPERSTDTIEAAFTDPLAQPQHTGQFFERKSSRGGLWAAAAGAVLVTTGVGVAVWLAERDPAPLANPHTPPAALIANLEDAKRCLANLNKLAPACDEPCLLPFRAERASITGAVDAARLDQCLTRCGLLGAGQFTPASADKIEQQVRALEGHPCRTELLEDLIDAPRLSVVGRAALVDAAARCATDVESARAMHLRDPDKERDKLAAPPWPKKKKRVPAVIHARVGELARRGRLALSVGDDERAKALLVEAVDLAPQRVELHERLGAALRGLGDNVGAAHHYRLYFHAFPDDADRERIERYLTRYGSSLDLKLEGNPGLDERHARVRRLLDLAAPQPPAQSLALLEEARALLPDDVEVLERSATVLVALNKNDEARSTLEQLLKLRPSRKLRERLKALGS